MNTLKKFTTFDEMKSGENKVSDQFLAVKKHSEFEKVIKQFMSVASKKSSQKAIKR